MGLLRLKKKKKKSAYKSRETVGHKKTGQILFTFRPKKDTETQR